MAPLLLCNCMAREFAKNFYSSPAWEKCRNGYVAHRRSIDGGLCEYCGQQVGRIVHHKVFLTPANINDPAVSLSWSNLMLVCDECHKKLHGIAQIRRISFDSDGNPIPPI